MKRTTMLLLALGLLSAPLAAQMITFEDVSPDNSDTHDTDPDGATGGRVHHVAIDPGDNQIMYAASEYGGLYKSLDGGATWAHLGGHLPQATWDIQVDSNDALRLYATSFFDGRTVPLSGINVSTDGGTTWSKPVTSTPPPGSCFAPLDDDAPTAFGISIDPTNSANVYIGTSCGLAISGDTGATWTHVNPGVASGGRRVWDVLSLGGGLIHTCGDDGHRRSTDNGATWVAGTGLPSGRCDLAVSPDESYVLFAVVGTSIYETTNANAVGGATWTNTRSNLSPQGRIPFVATNQRSDLPAEGSDNVFDLWFGDVSLFRVQCTTPTPAAPGGAFRCGTGNNPPWSPPYTRNVGGHDDTGDILFDSEAANDACPVLFSSDGGVYRNTDTTADCHAPNWDQPLVTPHALWPWSMSGVPRAGTEGLDLYFGNQDNGQFGTTTGGGTPNWTNSICCDGFDTAGDPAGAIFTVCCAGGGGPSTLAFRSAPGFVGGSPLNTRPPGGLLPTFKYTDSFAWLGTGTSYAAITRDCTAGQGGCVGTDGGLWLTTDVDATPIVWTELGNATEPPSNQICGLYVSESGGTPSFFVHTGNCNSGGTNDRLWRFDGTNPAGTWTELNLPAGGFGVVAVHPTDPNLLLASGLEFMGGGMYRSIDGGTTWSSLSGLDDLMTGGGDFPFRNFRGPSGFTSLTGYWQPTMVAFEANGTYAVAGATDAGVFLSNDSGATWRLITDPRTSNVSGTPHLPRPRYGYFDNEPGDPMRIYIGSQGAGIWRLTLEFLFQDGFESNDTSAWSVTVP